MHQVLCVITALILAGPVLDQNGSEPAGSKAWRPPIEPLTGLPLPLLEGEQLYRYADGCQSIVDPGVPITPSPPGHQLRWLGACRFGLIDGSGFIESTSPSATYLTPLPARLGRVVKGLHATKRFYRNQLRDTAWTFEIHPTLAATKEAQKGSVESLLPASLSDGKTWAARLGHVAWHNDREDVVETYAVELVPCPLPLEPHGRATASELLRKEGYAAESIPLLSAFCAPSFERLKRLRKELAPGWTSIPEEMARTDYGYYHQLKVTRANREGSGAITTTVERTPCPEPANGASCDATWRPIFERYQAVLDIELEREARVESDREVMISALETAFAEKRKQLAAKARARSP